MFDGKTFTRVEPVAVAIEGSWRSGQDWVSLLPTEGKAFAPRQPPYHRGEVFAFTTELNTRPDPDRDLRLVADHAAVAEVLDFRDRGEEAARRTLVEVGLEAIAPGTTEVIAALPNGVCVVMRVERPPEGGLLVARLQGLEALPVHKLDDSLFGGDRIEGRVLSVPGLTVGHRVRVTNWSRDADLLEFVLRRLRKVAAVGSRPVSLAQIGAVVSYLSRAGLLPALGADLEPLRARMSSLAAGLGNNLAVVEDLVELVASLRPVEARLNDELAERRATMEAEIRAEAEARLKGELEALELERHSRRGRLEAELADLEALVGVAEREAAVAKAARAELQQALRDELLC
jgi:hypothetical protein